MVIAVPPCVASADRMDGRGAARWGASPDADDLVDEIEPL
jgi:hypothetical protein